MFRLELNDFREVLPGLLNVALHKARISPTCVSLSPSRVECNGLAKVGDRTVQVLAFVLHESLPSQLARLCNCSHFLNKILRVGIQAYTQFEIASCVGISPLKQFRKSSCSIGLGKQRIDVDCCLKLENRTIQIGLLQLGKSRRKVVTPCNRSLSFSLFLRTDPHVGDL